LIILIWLTWPSTTAGAPRQSQAGGHGGEIPFEAVDEGVEAGQVIGADRLDPLRELVTLEARQTSMAADGEEAAMGSTSYTESVSRAGQPRPLAAPSKLVGKRCRLKRTEPSVRGER
jgi:hypothetical protein